MVEITKLKKTDCVDSHMEDWSQLLGTLTGKETHLDKNQMLDFISSPANTIFVAKNQTGKLVGIACVVQMDLLQGKRFHIESVVVHTEYQQQGIGTEVMKVLLDWIKNAGASHVTLTCN